MSTDFVKRYFEKINDRITTVNKQDPFSFNFTNAIANGSNVLFQKHMMETRIFDGSWVEYIEENLKYIDNVLRNPKSFIKENEDIVPIERAKKITAQSIRHLASHSQYVKSVSSDGEVTPYKILSVFKEEELAIYENRFVKTLIDKLVMFVERRYDTIKNLIGTDYFNKFHTTNEFVFGDMKINYELNLNISKRIHDIEAELKNHELLDRVESLRSQIIGFTNSEFMKTLKGNKAVMAPIQRTNILMKDSNYRKCYNLWLFLDSYGKLEYTIETSASEDKFNDQYIESLRELTLISVSTIIANDESNLGEFSTIPTVTQKQKKPKVLSSYDPELKKNEIQMESDLINEYYYQQARKLYSRRIDDRINDGDPFHVALKDIYQNAFKITEAIFTDLMNVPEEIKDDPRALLRFRMRNQKALDQILKYKVSDLKKMEKEKEANEKKIEQEKAKLEGITLSKITSPQEIVKAKEKIRLAKIKEIEKEKERLTKLIAKEEAKLEKEKEITLIKAQALFEKQKEKERLALEKQKEKEHLLLEKQKEKERLAKLHQKEKEKLALKKAKEKQKQKDKLAREKLKEKEKMRLAKLKESDKKKKQVKPKVTKKPVNEVKPVNNIINEDILETNIVANGEESENI